MSGAHRGEITGGDAFGRAAALAGALAEMGVREIAYLDDNGWVQFRARETDLPGLLTEAAAGAGAEVVCLERPLRAEIRPDRIVWETERAEAAAALEAVVARTA